MLTSAGLQVPVLKCQKKRWWRPLFPGGKGPAVAHVTTSPAGLLKGHSEPLRGTEEPQRLGARRGKRDAWDWGDVRNG